ncbi:MFS transporter [Salinilacihabitans rarus]|uniref:MFS transporter n=1 Tax=Salinilacihabitans rarus TaxID=2961596 RepID=UPI0020C8E62E|nr:MFS transporter [Salinilacihabitans rarus]
MRGPFANATFRRLFVGRVVTNVGDSLYFVAAMWLVYSLTGDPFYTGLAGFLTMVPRAFQFLAGPLVDQWSLRRTLVGTQFVQAVVVSTIPVAHAAGVLTVELVLVVMPALTALNQLVYPAQTAALPRILEDDDLVAANSAFSIAYQGLDMVANGVGGVLMGLFSAIALFTIDAVTFGLAALVFATLSIPAAGSSGGGDGDARATEDQPSGAGKAAADGGVAPLEESASYLTRLRAGVTALRGTFLVPLIGAAVVANFAAGMVLASIPAYADALGVPPALAAIGAAGGYGLLMASFAAGTFFGAVLASAIESYPFGRTMIVGFAASSALWTAGLLADWLPVTTVLFALAVVPTGVVNVQVAAIVQSAPPEELVGRVSSLLSSALSSLYPVGSLAGGVVAGAFGPRIAMGAVGVVALGQAGYVLLVDDLRTLPAPAETTLDME